MATHSSVLAWRIPGTGEPGGLLSLGSHRVRHNWSDLAACFKDAIFFHILWSLQRFFFFLLEFPSLHSLFFCLICLSFLCHVTLDCSVRFKVGWTVLGTQWHLFWCRDSLLVNVVGDLWADGGSGLSFRLQGWSDLQKSFLVPCLWARVQQLVLWETPGRGGLRITAFSHGAMGSPFSYSSHTFSYAPSSDTLFLITGE